MSGSFFVSRAIFDMFEGDEYSRREAWIWLFATAAWRATKTRVKNHTIPLERGQLAFSVRFLAQKWGWSKSRVERFLDALKKEDMIETRTGREITVITILNYNKYQLIPGYKRDTNGTQTGTRAGHERDKEEYLNKDNKKEYISPATREEDDRGFEDFWKAYPRRSTASPKKPAKLKYQAALKRGVAPEAILAGARAYAAEQEREGKVGTPYVKTPEVWINQECWTAFEAQPTGPPLPDDPIARRDLIWKQIEEENAKRAAEAASRNLLAGSYGVGEEKQPGPERPRVVHPEQRDAKGASGVVELFPEPPRVSAARDEDADRGPAIRIPLPRSMA